MTKQFFLADNDVSLTRQQLHSCLTSSLSGTIPVQIGGGGVFLQPKSKQLIPQGIGPTTLLCLDN